MDGYSHHDRKKRDHQVSTVRGVVKYARESDINGIWEQKGGLIKGMEL